MSPSRARTAVASAAVATCTFTALALTVGLVACSPSNRNPTAGATPDRSTAQPATSTGAPGSATPTVSSSPPAKPSGSPTKPPAVKPRPTNTGPAGSLRYTGDRTVALTFDDGPDPTYTPKILDLLKNNKVKATFCVVGFRAREHPELIKRIHAEGHSLCNHSWQHLFSLYKKTDAAILKDLQATNTIIRQAVPDAKIKYFRAPGGNYTSRLVRLAASLGMTSLYWAVDTRDWEFTKYGHGTPMRNHIVGSVKGSVRAGAIVLAHDLAKPDTIAAFAVLLPWLKSRFTLAALPT